MFQSRNLRLVLEQRIILLLRRLELHILVLSNIRHADPSAEIGEYLIVGSVNLAREFFDFGVLIIDCFLSLFEATLA